MYDGDPTAGTANLLGVSNLGMDIPPDDSVESVIPIDVMGLSLPVDVHFILNDTGHISANLPFDLTSDFPVTGTGECDFNNNNNNNIFQATGLDCSEICVDGIDNDGNGLADEPNITAPEISGCPGATLTQMTADAPGGVWSIISSIGSTIDGSGNVTLGNIPNNTPDIDTVIYTLSPCPDTVFITIIDNTPPVLTCPSNQTISADANCEYSLADFTSGLAVSDNCTDTGSLLLSQSPNSGTILFPGTTQVSLTAEDELANIGSCNFDIIVEDTTAPIFTCPPNATFPVDANCEYTLLDYTASVSVTDNCTSSGGISFTQSPIGGTTISGDGTNQTITLTADDGNGNLTNCSFNISLDDTVNPTITCPGNEILQVNANCEAIIPDLTTKTGVSDNCDTGSNIIITQNPLPGTILNGLNTTQAVTLTADDGSNNFASCIMTVSLADTIAPAITCPADQTITALECDYQVPDYRLNAIYSDNCTATGDITLAQNPPPGSVFSKGIYTFTFTVTDESGNANQCTFNVNFDLNLPRIKQIFRKKSN